MQKAWFLNVAVLIALMLVSAFFSGSETALMAANRLRIRHLSKSNRRARLVNRIMERPERLLGTLLLCNNLVNVALSALGTALALALLGESGIIYATFIITLCLLIFGEITPKTIAAYHPDRISLIISPIIYFCIRIFYPIVHVVSLFSGWLISLLGLEKPTARQMFTAEEIKSLIEVSADEGALEKDKQNMLLGVLTLEQITVGDIMVPIQEVVSISVETGYEDLLELVKNTQFSRYPVYEGAPAEIIGFIHVRDLLFVAPGERFSVRDILHEAHFVPELRSIRQQFMAFQRRRSHLSLVVDEYGNVVGLVTLEDILEEIVGEIEDEYDFLEREVERLSDGSYLIRGTMLIRDLNRRLELDLPEDDVRTIGGLIIKELGRIPRLEDEVRLKNYRLGIVSLKGKRVAWVRLWILPQGNGNSEVFSQ